MLIKTSEAIGSQLDWLVAKCEGFKVKINYLGCIHRLYFDHPPNYPFSPIYYSTDWAQGGPLLSSHIARLADFGDYWEAACYGVVSQGNTALEAICRAYVLAKLGENIEIPNELM